jgi:DNA-binding response OmpR family regulator
MTKILVVDDEPDVVEFLKQFLETKGYDIIEAFNGQEALQKALQEQPHVVLLDIKLPDISGLEVLRKIKAERPTLSIVMITGVDDQEIGRHAMKLGAYDYIVKPLDLEYLEKALWWQLKLIL